MAAFDTTRTVAASRDGVLTTHFVALIGAVISWNDARVTRKALSQLSARELEDIGLTYGDIAKIGTSAR